MTKEDVINSLEALKKKFDDVKSQDWIPTHRQGPTGVGKTFEDLIGKKEDNLQFADFGEYEIKAHLGKNLITLFTKSPISNEKTRGINSEIRDKYGVATEDHPDVKLFYPSISADKLTSLEGKYNRQFKLFVNRIEEKLYLHVYKDGDLESDEYFWNFSDFVAPLENKLKKIVIVQADSKKVIITSDGKKTIENFYKYQRMKIFTGLNLDNFIQAIEEGKVVVEPRLGVYKSGEKKGQPHDHGAAFRIDYSNLLKYGELEEYDGE